MERNNVTVTICIQHIRLVTVDQLQLNDENKCVRSPYSRNETSAAHPHIARQHLQQIAIDICCCRARPQQQTHRPLLLLSIDGTDRRTDGHLTVL